MKKILAFVLALIMIAAVFTACGSKNDNETTKSDVTSSDEENNTVTPDEYFERW